MIRKKPVDLGSNPSAPIVLLRLPRIFDPLGSNPHPREKVSRLRIFLSPQSLRMLCVRILLWSQCGRALPDIEKIRRNLRITRKRSPGERPHSVMKGIMHGGHTFVTMVRRYRVKAMFLCLGYNMLTLITLKKQGRVA
jgi:hypothetical protein